MKQKFVPPEGTQTQIQRIRLTARLMLSLKMAEEALSKIFLEKVFIEHSEVTLLPINRRGGNIQKKDSGRYDCVILIGGMAGGIKFWSTISMIHRLNLWLPASVQVQIGGTEHNFVYSNEPDGTGNLNSKISRNGKPDEQYALNHIGLEALDEVMGNRALGSQEA
jgi:hypothetical protein